MEYDTDVIFPRCPVLIIIVEPPHDVLPKVPLSASLHGMHVRSSEIPVLLYVPAGHATRSHRKVPWTPFPLIVFMQSLGGTIPIILLSAIESFVNGAKRKSDGMNPDRLLLDKSNVSRYSKNPILRGIVPCKFLPGSSIPVTCPRELHVMPEN
jgi:hypothetical protein